MTVRYLIDQINLGRTVIFDLDNTIYNENEFLTGVYELISYKQKKYNPYEIFDYLSATLYSEGASRIFDKLFQRFPLIDITLDDFLFHLRNYKAYPLIRPYAWYIDFINALENSFDLKIITNGNVTQQMNKISSIDLCLPESRYSVVYANSIAPKPSPLSFYSFHDSNKFINPIYIGDSEVDKLFCDNLSIQFFDVNALIS